MTITIVINESLKWIIATYFYYFHYLGKYQFRQVLGVLFIKDFFKILQMLMINNFYTVLTERARMNIVIRLAADLIAPETFHQGECSPVAVNPSAFLELAWLVYLQIS